MADPQNEANDNPALTREWKGETDDRPDEAYDPSDIEATRARMQGLGVGARDIERQGDPERDLASDLESLSGTPDADPSDGGS